MIYNGIFVVLEKTLALIRFVNVKSMERVIDDALMLFYMCVSVVFEGKLERL